MLQKVTPSILVPFPLVIRPDFLVGFASTLTTCSLRAGLACVEAMAPEASIASPVGC